MMNQEKHKVVYKIKGGTWENKTNKPLVEFVEGDGVSKNIPVYMRHKMFHKSKGSWDKDPYTTRITEDTVFTYKYKLDPFFPLLAYSFVAILLAFSLFLSNSFKKKNNKPVIKDNMIAVAENIDYDDLVDPVVDDDPSRNPNFNTDSISFGDDDTTTTNTDTPSLVNGEDLTYYTVSFLNIDGSVLQSGRYQVGSVPSYTGSTPTYSDNEYRYTFTGWGSISAVTGNATYTAQYSRERIQQDDPTPQVTRYTISTSVNDESMGSVSGAGTYDANATATLTATAISGYHFVKWSDENTDNPRTVTVTSDATYEAIFEQDVTTPVKGNVIKLKNIYGNDPTAEYRFRVLSIDGNEAKLLALFNASDSQVFNSNESNVYADSELDTYLNTTWYGTLSDAMKGAIQPTTIVQNTFKWNNGVPADGTQNVVAKGTGSMVGNYYITGGYESTLVGDRNVFVLDVQDVIDYFDGEDLSEDRIKIMFNIGRPYVDSYDILWLRSAFADYSDIAWYVEAIDGSLITYYIGRFSTLAARPAFNIDLSVAGIEFETE